LATCHLKSEFDRLDYYGLEGLGIHCQGQILIWIWGEGQFEPSALLWVQCMGRGDPPQKPEKFFKLGVSNFIFWCILGPFWVMHLDILHSRAYIVIGRAGLRIYLLVWL